MRIGNEELHILGFSSHVALGLRSRLDSTDYFGFGILRRSTAYFRIGVHVIVPRPSMGSC